MTYNKFMKIASPKLFYFSLASLITTILIAKEFHQVIGAAVTRDFNFGEPLVYILLLIQGCSSIVGMVTAIKSSRVNKV